jgi:hypothetical protein
MKKGVILYVTGGQEELFFGDASELENLRRRLGVQNIWVATSEDEISDGWWRLVAQGMQEVSCLLARFNSAEGKLEPAGRCLRLCG